jgi:Tol biopolymer transport system component
MSDVWSARSFPAQPPRPTGRSLIPSVALTLLLTACSGESSEESTPSPSGSASASVSVSASEPEPPPAEPIDPSALTGTIAYSTVVEDASADDVFVVELGRGEPIRLTDGPEREFDPALSPDGRLIAYRRNPRADSDEADIWVMAVDGSGKRNLTRSAQDSNWAPAWTSDGRIVYSSMRAGGGALELWSMRADGSARRRVAEGWCEYPSPSPDGQRYACATAVGGHYDIVVVDDDGAWTELTSTPETEFGAAWSPDGEWIVFSRDHGDRWELLRVRPDGTDEQTIAPEGVFATWDPAGHLAWSGPGGINVANPDGSGLTTLDYPAEFLSWR